MPTHPSMFNIAIVGGGSCCKEILDKATLNFEEKGVNARFTTVVDPNPRTPGMRLAKKLGLRILNNPHDLYAPEYDIHLIIVSQPKQTVFKDILMTRPPHIRIMNYHVFNLFWKAIQSEERKLKAQNEEMKTILNGIQDFILVITPDMEVVEANGAFLDKMGYQYDEIIGMKCYEIYQKTYNQCMSKDSNCPLLDVIRNKRKSRMMQTRVMANQELRYYEVDVYPVWEKSGKISKFIHISRDVTDRKRQELEIKHQLEEMVEERTRQLKETHEKLLHQDKMASLGKLSASVVHEINNPIAGILNLIMLVQRICREGPLEKKEMEQFGQYLNLMETETRRIGKIVSNLLAFSRQSRVELHPVDINRLIERTLFMNLNLLKLNKIKVEKKLDPELPELTGSEDQLEQVCMNFVSNAAESMESTEERILSIETRFNPRQNTVMAVFADTGVGIPKGNLSKLFEPFFTTKKRGKSIGLGLSVAYGIIKDHGGCIQVDSDAGQGATFTIELPANLKKPESKQPSA